MSPCCWGRFRCVPSSLRVPLGSNWFVVWGGRMMPALIRAIVVLWKVKPVGDTHVVGDKPVVRSTPVVSYIEDHPVSFVIDGGGSGPPTRLLDNTSCSSPRQAAGFAYGHARRSADSVRYPKYPTRTARAAVTCTARQPANAAWRQPANAAYCIVDHWHSWLLRPRRDRPRSRCAVQCEYEFSPLDVIVPCDPSRRRSCAGQYNGRYRALTRERTMLLR